MRLLEDRLKPLLRAHGVAVPDGAPTSDAAACTELVARHPRVVVKALSGDNDRAARGHVVVLDASEAADALATSEEWGYPAWLEEAVPHADELFVGVVWTGERDHPTLLLGKGGSGIEQRAADDVARIPLAGSVEEALDGLELVRRWPELTAVSAGVVELFEDLDALSLELNPVVPREDGGLVALDAKAFVDPYGRGPAGDPDGSTGGTLLEFAALDGDVGVLSLGAGLTRALIDWLDLLGRPAACFSDLIPAVLADAKLLLSGREGPECERAAAWLCGWLAERGSRTLVVNLVSGGTPIDALSRSVLRGIDAAGWTGDVVPHVGGNRAAPAGEIWVAAGFAPAATFEDALSRAAAGA